MKNLLFTIKSTLVLMAFVSLFAGAQAVVAQEQPAADSTTTAPTTQQQEPANTAVGGGTNADNVCKGVLSAETGTFAPNTTVAACQESGDSSFGFLVRRIINVFSIVVGAVSVIMIIIGGFRYIISGGDSSGVSGAKNTILYAIVGLVIVLFAQVIIRFILTNAASVTK